MPTQFITSDVSVVSTLAVAFLANIFKSLGDVEVSTWFAVGTFGVAIVVSMLKARVFYLDAKIKKLQLDKLKEDNETGSD